MSELPWRRNSDDASFRMTEAVFPGDHTEHEGKPVIVEGLNMDDTGTTVYGMFGRFHESGLIVGLTCEELGCHQLGMRATSLHDQFHSYVCARCGERLETTMPVTREERDDAQALLDATRALMKRDYWEFQFEAGEID
jgi:hypothetical protein